MRVVRVITRLNRGGPLRQLEALVPGLARLGVVGPVLTGAVPEREDDGTADLVARGVEVIQVPGLVRGISPWHDWKASRWLRALSAWTLLASQGYHVAAAVPVPTEEASVAPGYAEPS